MSVKLLNEHSLEFLSLKGGCPSSSESIHDKIPHCWKSHVAAHYPLYFNLSAMTTTALIKFYLYLVSVLHCGGTTDQALELLISLQESYCGYSQTCDDTSSTTQTGMPGPLEPCCSKCSCSEYCHLYGNCCLSNVNNDSYQGNSDATRFSCLYPRLLPTHARPLLGNSYYTIKKCDSLKGMSRTRLRCEAISWRWNFLSDLIPVYMPEAEVLYKNIPCASCSDVDANQLVFLDPVLKCMHGDIAAVIEQDDPEQIFAYLQDRIEETCNIVFEMPPGLLTNQRQSLECYSQIDIESCNVTGLWTHYDPVLNTACDEFNAPVRIFDDDHGEQVFKNLACYKCNKQDLNESEPVCNGNDDVVKLTLNYMKTPNDVEQEPALKNYDVSEGTEQCNEGFFLDTYKVSMLKCASRSKSRLLFSSAEMFKKPL